MIYKGNVSVDKTFKIDSQVQFWILVGPILLIIAMLAVLIKGDPKDWILAIIAVFGIPCCWKWKRPGFLAAIGLLAVAFFFQMTVATIEERFWILALSTTIAMGFIVTALSFEEAEEIIQSLEVESKSRLDNLFQLDEKFKEAQFSFQKERELLTAKVKQAQVEAEEKSQQLSSYEKAIGLAKGEIAAAQANREKLLQEVFDTRHEAMLLQQKLEEMHQQQMAVESLQAKEEEFIILKSQLQTASEEIQFSQKQMEKYALELAALKEVSEFHEATALQAQEEQILNQAILQEMSEHIESLTREKDLLESTLARLQTELESHLTYTQSLKAIAERREQELQIEKASYEEYKITSEGKVKMFSAQIEDLSFKWSQATQQIAQWQHQLSELQNKLNAQQAEIQSMTQEKSSILQSLEEKKGLILTLEEKNAELQVLQAVPSSVNDERNAARAEAKYAQLRQQFEEKSSVLDATRRELFLTQEELLRLQKEMDEMHVFEINETEAKLQDFLISMEKDLSHKEMEHQDEVQALHDVISSLICR